MEEESQIIYAGIASLEEMRFLSFEKPPPIKLEVRDGREDYELMFFYGSRKTPRAMERQQNIAELVSVYNQGALIRVTGIILEKHELETIVEGESIPVDKSIYFGLITLKYKGRKQRYTYYQDYGDPSTIENTILTKGDYIVPQILGMQRVM